MNSEQLHAVDRISQLIHQKPIEGPYTGNEYRMVNIHDLSLAISAINDLEKENESIMYFKGETK